MPADASRRFLVAAGTEHYVGGDELSSVPEDLRKMAAFFGRLGYCEQLPEVRLDPSSTALSSALSKWLTSSERHDSDTAVFYYTGHGSVEGDYFYLLTADTEDGRYAATALPPDYVIKALGETPKVRRVLLILDTCYAGRGAFDASRVAAGMSPWQNFGDGEGIWVVAAASPKQEAQERLFADAFIEAAEQLQQITGERQRYIGLETLMEEINKILQRNGKQQRARYIPVTQATGLAPFIPNLRYDPYAPPDVDPKTRDWLRRHAAELAEYWGPKARGVEVAAQVGWYFTGRGAALAEISAWLADPAADTRLRVVTGDPGSGKSAVLGRLVTLAGRGSALQRPDAPADPSSVPPVGSIAAALLARGKTADDLHAELTASLGIAANAVLADELVLRRQVFVVVIDALDEAADPPAVIEEVIAPLNAAASPGRGPRLLVATRRYQHLLGSLPAARVTIDLDQDAYRNETDTADYVTKVLLAADDPESRTPYRDQPDLASLVARQVAAIAGPSFLIAQIAARTLVRTPRVLDPAEVSADRQRWSDVGTAFDHDLDRYGEKARRVRDLLTPLAWAEGAGLPRELWAPLATALADDEDYTQADITWLIEQAGVYLVEILDQERSVYRLYHERFAEHLRATHSPGSAHKAITAELLQHVPVTTDGRREWVAAAPYIRSHLATHAAKGQVLDPLVSDPGFLLAADPARLLPRLAAITDPEARRSASAFESMQHILPGQPLGQAAAQLDLAARVHGAAILADSIGHLPYERPWTIAWGRWVRPDRHILLGRHAGSVQAVATAMLDESPVAVTGGRDGTVRVWDLRAGIPRGEPLQGPPGGVAAVAAGKVEGTPVAVAANSDGRVRLWDLRTGTAHGKPLRPGSTFSRWSLGQHDLSSMTRALVVWDLDGTPVAVTGGYGRAQVWDLRTGATRGGRMPRYARFRVTAMAVGQVDGVPVVVTGGSGARVWDLRTGAGRGKRLLPWGSFRRLLVWMQLYGWIVVAVAVSEVDGTPVAVTGGRDGTVRVWDLRTGAARGEPLQGHTGSVEAVATGEVDGTPVAVTGGRDRTVRVWDLRTGAPRGKPLPSAGAFRRLLLMYRSFVNDFSDSGLTVRAVTVGKVDGTPVAVAGGFDGRVRVWDLRTGAPRGKPLLSGGIFRRMRMWSYDLTVRAVALAEVDSIPIAVAGGFDDTVRMWDLRTGAARGKPFGSHHPRKIKLYEAAVSTADTAREGEWVPHPGRVEAIAVSAVDGTPVAVTSARDGTVRAWDLRTGAAREKPFQGHTGRVEAIAAGEVDGTPVAVVGDSNGAISMRAIDRDQRTSARLDAPAGITAIAFADQVGWLTSTEDGSLFIWSPALTPRHTPGRP